MKPVLYLMGWRVELGLKWLGCRVRNLLAFLRDMCLWGVKDGVKGAPEAKLSSSSVLMHHITCNLVNPFYLGLCFCICNGTQHGSAILPLVGASWTCLCLGSSLARCSVSALSQPETMGQAGQATHQPETQSPGAPPWTIFSP